MIVDTVAKVVRSRDPLFRIVRPANRQTVQSTDLGKQFFLCSKYDLSEIDRQYPKHRFSPFYTIFRRHAYNAWDGDDERLRPHTAHTLNAAVEAIRNEAKVIDLKREIDNFHRSERSNAKRARELLAKIRRMYSKVLILRLDLEYLSIYGPGAGFHAHPISFEIARCHRDQFLAYLRTGPFAEHLVGYIWKMEYGFEKGYHTHYVIALNAQKVCRDILIAHMLGMYWKHTITAQAGMFWNCNKNKESYDQCYLGMLTRKEAAKWELLGEKVRYLTKVDHYIRLAPLFRCCFPDPFDPRMIR